MSTSEMTGAGASGLDEADRLVAEGRAAEAARIYERALASGENLERALVGRGVAALCAEDNPRALERFTEAVARLPRSTRAQLGLGLARLAMGYARAARTAFCDCLALDPGNIDAASHLVRAAFATQEYAAAEGHLCSVLERRPDEHHLRFTLVGVQLLAGRVRAAERTLDELCARAPDYPDVASVRERVAAARGSDAQETTVRGRFVIAVIPARGGSKGIPRKNLRELDGRPLIAHSIEAARAARFVDVVVVSTEDEEIARAAREHGAEVALRPAELATDLAPTEPALLHAVEAIERRHEATADCVLLLQATSPLRPASAIDAAVVELYSAGCDSVVAVRSDMGAHFTGVVRDGRFMPPYDPRARKRRQELEPLYRETGALYAVTRALLFTDRCRMGGHMRPLVLDEEEATDIDTLADFNLVERIIEARRRA